jgi:hypothetical protein
VPDLARTSVLEWLHVEEPDKPELATDPVTVVEAAPVVENALVRLGNALDRSLLEGTESLAATLKADPGRQELRTVIGQLGLPRSLRVMHWIMQAGIPDGDAVLAAVLEGDETGTGQFLQATLAAAVRPSLLARLYAPERLALLLNACQPAIQAREAA